MSEFKLTPDALDDMRDIARYTERQWGRGQRNKYLINLNQCFERLAENPKLAKLRDDIKHGYRSYPQGKHVIFFVRKKATLRY